MAIPDNKGNTLAQVHIEHDGYVAINTAALVPPTLAELQAATLPTDYTYLGLLTQGYDEDVTVGDTVPMWVPNYEIQSGEFGVGGKIIAAEDNSLVKTLLGYTVSGSGANQTATRANTHYLQNVGLITATIDQTGQARIRGGLAIITGISPSYGVRGEINTVEISFNWLHVSNTYYTEVVRDMACAPTDDGTGNTYDVMYVNPDVIFAGTVIRGDGYEFFIFQQDGSVISYIRSRIVLDVQAGDKFRIQICGVFETGQYPTPTVLFSPGANTIPGGSFIAPDTFTVDYTIPAGKTRARFAIQNRTSAPFTVTGFKVTKII